MVVRSRVDPGVVSGWHHHGDYGIYGYVVSGSARFEDGEARAQGWRPICLGTDD
jgi:quercetin dioxygenase-like cupin family protein